MVPPWSAMVPSLMVLGPWSTIHGPQRPRLHADAVTLDHTVSPSSIIHHPSIHEKCNPRILQRRVKIQPRDRLVETVHPRFRHAFPSCLPSCFHHDSLSFVQRLRPSRTAPGRVNVFNVHSLLSSIVVIQTETVTLTVTLTVTVTAGSAAGMVQGSNGSSATSQVRVVGTRVVQYHLCSHARQCTALSVPLWNCAIGR